MISIDVHVLVVRVAAIFIIVSVLCVRLVVIATVVVAMVVVVVVAVAAVVAIVVVAAVPCRISVVRPAVVYHRGAMPPAVPTAVTPAAAPAAHHCSDGNSSAESNNAGGSDVASRIPRGYIWRAIDNRWVVLRHIHNLWIGRLDDDHLGRLLHDSHLGRGLEIAGSLGFRAQSLNGRHDL